MDKRRSVSILLLDNFRSLEPRLLPEILFARNKGLGGALKVTHVKTYGREETSRAGQSKKGWRLILLQGCANFMKSLESFEEDHKFTIGSSFVYIRGGVRRPRQHSRNQQARGPPRSANPRRDTGNTSSHDQTQNRPLGHQTRKEMRGRGRGSLSDAPPRGDPSALGRRPGSASTENRYPALVRHPPPREEVSTQSSSRNGNRKPRRKLEANPPQRTTSRGTNPSTSISPNTNPANMDLSLIHI